MYAFSLVMYYPQLDNTEYGRMPFYLKLIPRGELADPMSDISSLDLLSVINF